MYSALPSFVLGFHGCDEAVAARIFSGQTSHLTRSQNSYDWLGGGIYFWESSSHRALEWARLRKAHPSGAKSRRIINPAVVGAVIDLGNCLNLLDSRFVAIVRDGHAVLRKALEKSGVPMPLNKPLRGSGELLLRDLDCAVINMVHLLRQRKHLPPFDSVRAAFIEGQPIYDGGAFYDKNHIQICVCNPACIKGYFRPLPETTPT